MEKELPLFNRVEPAASSPKGSTLEPDEAGAAQAFSKYIVYVDESGDHGLQTVEPQFPVFVLAFCVFHKGHYSEKVVPTLENLSSSISGMIKSSCTKAKSGEKKGYSAYSLQGNTSAVSWTN